MSSKALLEDGETPSDLAVGLEVTQQDHRVGDVADVDGRLNLAEQPVGRENHERQDPGAREIAEQVVEPVHELSLAGHRLKVSADAVDRDDAYTAVLDVGADHLRELAGRDRSYLHLTQLDEAAFDVIVERHRQRSHASQQRAHALVETVDRRRDAAKRRGVAVQRRERALARAGRPGDHASRPCFETAAEELVDAFVPAGDGLSYPDSRGAGHHSRVDAQATGSDVRVVVPGGEVHPAHLRDEHASPRSAELRSVHLEPDHSVDERLQRPVGKLAAESGGKHRRTRHGVEELLQAQDLTPQLVARVDEDPELAQRVDEQTLRLVLSDRRFDRVGDFGELDVAGGEDRLATARRVPDIGRELGERDSLQVPTVRRDDIAQLGERLKQRDPQAPLSGRGAGAQKLETKGGLARAGRSVDEVDPPGGEPTTEDRIQAVDPGAVAFRTRLRHEPSLLYAAPLYRLPGARATTASRARA